MNELGVLLVGGMRSHQENHADVFKANPKCRLVASADEKDAPEWAVELNSRLAEVHGIPYIPDLDEALARDDVDIVSAVPQVERRGRIGARCIEAGKHVYFDKPLAGYVEDLDLIVNAAEASDVTTQMFCQNKAAWVQAAKQAVEDGTVGELKAVHIEGLFTKGRAGSIAPGVVRRKETERPERYTFIEGKHEMFDVTIYSMAMLRALTSRRIESVYCQTSNYFHAQHVEMGVEDFGAMALTLEGGLTATVIGGRFGWMSHPANPQRIVLTGTEGSLTFDGARPRIELYNDEPDFSMPPAHPLDPSAMWSSTQAELDIPPKRRWVSLDTVNTMAEDVADFVECVETGRTPDITAQVAAPITEAILGGYVSAARGGVVELPLPRE